MYKHKTLAEFLRLSKDIDSANEAIDELRHSYRELKDKLLAIKIKLKRTEILSEEEQNELKMQSEILQGLINDFKSTREDYKKEKEEMIHEMSVLYFLLKNVHGVGVNHNQMERMISKACNKKCKFSTIKSYSGVVLGFACVSEQDPNFNKTIKADCSLVKNEIYLENTDTLKIVNMGMDCVAKEIENRWDWFDYYVFATTGFYIDKSMIPYYRDFATRDQDFAELMVYVVHSDFISDPIFNLDEDSLFYE